MKSCGGGRGIAPLILNLFATWTRVVVIRPRWLDHRQIAQVPYEYEAGWAPETLDFEGDINTAGPLRDSNPTPSSL
jgi:hypothetical protein